MKTKLLLLLLAGAAIARPTFPATMTVDEQALMRNGVGLCEWGIFGIDLYHAALYRPTRTTDAATVINSDEPCVIVLHFVRPLSREQMRAAYQASFDVNAGDEHAKLAQRFTRFLDLVPAVQDGQRLRFVVRPLRDSSLLLDDRLLGTIEGEDFARLLLRMYVGDKPPTRDLRRGLLGKG